MLRLATFNVNGIRASVRRGFASWVAERSPDIAALQEMRSPTEAVPAEAVPDGYRLLYHPGELAGRNGVALLLRSEWAPTAVRYGFGSAEFDPEGRYLEADLVLPGQRQLTVASLYLPKGGTPFEDEKSLRKHRRKLRFCRALSRHLVAARRRAREMGAEFVVMGDFNVAPDERDVDNARRKHRAEGFLPVEREWIASIMGPRTLWDVVRYLHGDAQGPYSWWSWRGQAWANDTGWRIDHHLATPGLARTAESGGTDRDASYEARMSDHAPVVVDYTW